MRIQRLREVEYLNQGHTARGPESGSSRVMEETGKSPTNSNRVY